MSWSTKVWFFTLVLGCTFSTAGSYQFDSAVRLASLKNRPARGNIQFDFVLPELQSKTTRDGFEVLEAPGLEKLNSVGEPDLFSTGALVFVPDGFEPRLIVNKMEQQEISNILVAPCQKKNRCGPEIDFQFHSQRYLSNEIYPSAVVRLEELGKVQGIRLVRIAITPVQVFPSSRQLIITHHLQFEISFEKTRQSLSQTLTPAAFDLIQKSVVNGNDLASYVRLVAMDRMVVMVADDFKLLIQPFVEWKRQRGIEVQVVTFSEAGGTKEKVSAHLKQLYKTSKFSYLLFAGNKTTLPAFMESTANGPAASDYRFSLLSGATQDIPDVFYGRFIANTAEELNHQMQRSIDYEKNAPSGATWYANGLTIASSGVGGGPSDKQYAEQVRTALQKGTYKDFDVFLEAEGSATAKNIQQSLAGGKTWLAYFGHGSGTSWASTNDPFSNAQVAWVQNAGRLPILIDVACDNASWVNLPVPFGKAWVTQTDSGKEVGAVAYYGGSVSISWDEPAVMSVGIALNHFEKNIPSVGGSVLSGQLYLFEKMGKQENTLDNLRWYNLFGDPSLQIRTTTPKPYGVFQTMDTDSHRSRLKVTLKDTAGLPVKGATLSLTKNGALLASTQSDANGKADLTVNRTSTEWQTGLLTTSGYNLETYEKQVTF